MTEKIILNLLILFFCFLFIRFYEFMIAMNKYLKQMKRMDRECNNASLTIKNLINNGLKEFVSIK